MAVRLSDGGFSAVVVSFESEEKNEQYALLHAPEFVLQQMTNDEGLVATLIAKHGFIPVPTRTSLLRLETLYEDLALLARAML